MYMQIIQRASQHQQFEHSQHHEERAAANETQDPAGLSPHAAISNLDAADLSSLNEKLERENSVESNNGKDSQSQLPSGEATGVWIADIW